MRGTGIQEMLPRQNIESILEIQFAKNPVAGGRVAVKPPPHRMDHAFGSARDGHAGLCRPEEGAGICLHQCDEALSCESAERFPDRDWPEAARGLGDCNQFGPSEEGGSIKAAAARGEEVSYSTELSSHVTCRAGRPPWCVAAEAQKAQEQIRQGSCGGTWPRGLAPIPVEAAKLSGPQSAGEGRQDARLGVGGQRPGSQVPTLWRAELRKPCHRTLPEPRRRRDHVCPPLKAAFGWQGLLSAGRGWGPRVPERGPFPVLPAMEPVQGEGRNCPLVFAPAARWGAEDALRKHQQFFPRLGVIAVCHRGQGAGEHLGPEVPGCDGDMAQGCGLAGLDVRERRQSRTSVTAAIPARSSTSASGWPAAWVSAIADRHAQAAHGAATSVVGVQPVRRDIPSQCAS